MTDTEQTETRRQVAERVVAEWADLYQVTQAGPGTKSRLVDAIEAALKAEREQALTEAARQECVFCAGVKGYNPTPLLTAGSYVHRNDPPHGLAGVYCKALQIHALLAETESKDA